METNNDNIRQLLEMLDNPEVYIEQEIQDIINRDENTRETYRMMVEAKRSSRLRQADKPVDVDAAWQKFNQINQPKQHGFIWMQIAASIIGVLMLSGISYAAISHLITMDSKSKVAITERKPDVKKVKKTYGIEAAPTKQAPVIYNNVELQQIMQYIADGYGVKVEFKNEATRTLRFYLQWEADDTLQEIIDKINHFEKVHLTLNEDTIFIE